MYRIGYLVAAGSAAPDVQTLETAALALGHSLTVLSLAELRESSPFDVLIATSPQLRKATSHPLFLADHQPRAAYFDAPDTFNALAAFDGYLCLSDNLARFFSALAESLDKPVIEPGFFYPLPLVRDTENRGPTLALAVPTEGPDLQAVRVLRGLASRPYVAPFHKADSVTSQHAYAKSGLGLVLSTQERVLEDLAPQDLFDAVAAGALALCPDMPWIRKHFGDAVVYYDGHGPPEDVVASIDAAVAAALTDPPAAKAKAVAAQAILRDRFGPETLLHNVVSYFERWRDASRARAAVLPDAIIDVIMRVGGRAIDVIERAVTSLDSQSAGRFRLILVAHQPIDLTPVTARRRERIVETVTLEVKGGNRAKTLAAGLGAVRSPYFSLLDDDDYLLSRHFEGLLAAMRGLKATPGFAYCDVLRFNEADGTLGILQEGPAHGDIFHLLSRFPSHCFMATGDALDGVGFAHWDLHTAEDSLLVASLLRRAAPVHSPHATAVYCQGRPGASNFMEDQQRLEDELALFTRIASWRADIEAKFPSAAPDLGSMIGPYARRLAAGKVGRGRLADAVEIVESEANVEAAAVWGADLYGGAFADEPMVFLPVPLDSGRTLGEALTVLKGMSGVRAAARQPWQVMLRVDLADYAVAGCVVTAVAAIDGADEAVVFGLLNQSGETIGKTMPPPRAGMIAAACAAPAGALNAVYLQAGPVAAAGAVGLRGLKLGYRLSELRESLALGDSSASPQDLLAALETRVLSQVLGAPDGARPTLDPVSFRTEACVYRKLVADGPFAEGAMRTVTTGEKPWDYFAQIHLPAGGPGARWIRVVVRDTAEPFHAFLVDERFERRLSDAVPVTAGKARVEIWLKAPEGGAGAYIVFQAGEAPRGLPMTLERVEAAA